MISYFIFFPTTVPIISVSDRMLKKKNYFAYMIYDFDTNTLATAMRRFRSVRGHYALSFSRSRSARRHRVLRRERNAKMGLYWWMHVIRCNVHFARCVCRNACVHYETWTVLWRRRPRRQRSNEIVADVSERNNVRYARVTGRVYVPFRIKRNTNANVFNALTVECRSFRL